MPPIHPDLTEQRYALLGFGSHCQLCATFTRSSTDWSLQVRWCSKCRENQLLSQYCDIDGVLSSVRVDRVCLRQDLLLRQTFISFRRPPKRVVLVCPKEELELFTLKAVASSDESWESYVSQQRAKKQALEEHATLCTEWTKGRISQRENELDLIRAARKNAVRSKLENMGFLKAFVDHAVAGEFPGLRVAKPLLDKGCLILSSPINQPDSL
ncbi:uncharacterized protein EI90DRAFT_3078564 [Cantharellus anzutake]|uniref:uncharacterized protein n=1 Tax=Cantharellus anzutake TaxID=1750568 RepID=UPI0019069289|nr:uncharacterized protein EI90DRAFT_3078564 [Cantharellus anzutake]KAF8321933.1 hypothetical protein EI90DRAFT_3078564 [Cantharellus anzutake]